jgi:hypothetical protein
MYQGIHFWDHGFEIARRGNFEEDAYSPRPESGPLKAIAAPKVEAGA